MRALGAAIALVALLAAGAASAVPCASMYSRSEVDGYGWNVFFAKTSFGTVGFARDSKNLVYVPKANVGCVSLPQPRTHLYIVFNHRQSDSDGVGYVSFKLYGMTQGTPVSRARALIRRGSWHRDAHTRLPGDPWAQPVLPEPDAAIIGKYEAFYARGSSNGLGAFDQMYGTLHGTPDGSNQSSWDGRFGMQPGSGAVDLSKVGYLRHELQRVEISAKTNAPGDPPLIETHQFQYRNLLVTVASPLGEGTQRTILFKFTN